MTTKRKADANRLNAQKSTGPRTDKGKASVRQNAIRHGLLAKAVVLSSEDEQQYLQLRQQLWDHWAPVGQPQEGLVERLAGLAWRLERFARIEVGLIENYRVENQGSTKNSAALAFEKLSQTFSVLARYQAQLSREYFAVLHELQRLEAARAGQVVPPPAAADVNLHLSVDEQLTDAFEEINSQLREEQRREERSKFESRMATSKGLGH